METKGLLPNIIALATWAIRIKVFFKNMWNGIKDTFKGIYDWLDRVLGKLPVLEMFFGKNTSAVEKWAKAGKVAGVIVASMLTYIAVKQVWLAGVWIAKNVAMAASSRLLRSSVGRLFIGILLIVGVLS